MGTPASLGRILTTYYVTHAPNNVETVNSTMVFVLLLITVTMETSQTRMVAAHFVRLRLAGAVLEVLPPLLTSVLRLVAMASNLVKINVMTATPSTEMVVTLPAR